MTSACRVKACAIPRDQIGVYEIRLALPEGDCWETKAAEFLANRALTWGIGRRSLAAQLKLCPTQTGRETDHAIFRNADIQQETRSVMK